MKLKSLEIRGLKCYEYSNTIPFYDLTVFIGENDAGKSTILDALEMLFNHKAPQDSDYRDDKKIEIEAVFLVNDSQEGLENFMSEGKLRLRRTFEQGGVSKTEIFKECFVDDDLNNYETEGATETKRILTKLGIENGRNQEERCASIREYVQQRYEELDKRSQWQTIQWGRISNFLPIFQRFSSDEYGTTKNIQQTLSIVYREAFYEHDGAGSEMLRQNFVALREDIIQKMDVQLKDKLLGHIKKYKPEIASIGGSYDIDFARGFTFSGLSIVDSSGCPRSLEQIGKGSRNKVFLSVLEWDAELNLKDSASNKSIIRGYDEPDENLHYDAQRRMFYVISGSSTQADSKIQSMICTHSLTMIDRAPARCINHVKRNEESKKSEVSYLQNHDDDGIKEFLEQISEISGIKNSSIFYEKCFLVFEGLSEQNALPAMYKKCKGRTISEDGIILINLETNGQWKNALKFLSVNKESCTVMLLDSDCQTTTSGCGVTKRKLEEIGFNQLFLRDQCFFVGNKEFEDVFTDAQYASMCNDKFPKQNGVAWTDNDFTVIRTSDKFSERLKSIVSAGHGKWVSKPEIAEALAKSLTKEELEGIVVIKRLFDKIDNILE